jgi:hypothetical protein
MAARWATTTPGSPPPEAPLQGPAASLRAVGGSGVLLVLGAHYDVGGRAEVVGGALGPLHGLARPAVP